MWIEIGKTVWFWGQTGKLGDEGWKHNFRGQRGKEHPCKVHVFRTTMAVMQNVADQNSMVFCKTVTQA